MFENLLWLVMHLKYIISYECEENKPIHYIVKFIQKLITAVENKGKLFSLWVGAQSVAATMNITVNYFPKPKSRIDLWLRAHIYYHRDTCTSILILFWIWPLRMSSLFIADSDYYNLTHFLHPLIPTPLIPTSPTLFSSSPLSGGSLFPLLCEPELK